jgi:hypothetical protein
VRGADAKPVVAKPGANSGQIWWPMWRRFLVGEVDGVLTDGGSRSSSRWSSGVGPQNGAFASKQSWNSDSHAGTVVAAAAKGSR